LIPEDFRVLARAHVKTVLPMPVSVPVMKSDFMQKLPVYGINPFTA
jgi:hypothetical protein